MTNFRSPRLIERMLMVALALSLGARLVAAAVVVEFSPGAVSVAIPGAAGALGASNQAMILPSVDFARNLSYQAGMIVAAPASAPQAVPGAAPAAVAPVPLSVQLQSALQASVAAGAPRGQAVAVQSVLIQALSDPRTLAAVQARLRETAVPGTPDLGAEAAARLGGLAAEARQRGAAAGLDRYAGELKGALAASLAGDASGFDHLFDGLVAGLGAPATVGAVRADGATGAATGSESRARLARRGLPSLGKPAALSGTVGFSPEFDALYGPAMARYGAGVAADSFKDFDPLTEIHLQSHLSQADEWLDAGLITPEAHDFVRGFIRDHDRAYVYETPQDVETRGRELKEVWTAIGMALHGGDRAAAEAAAAETYALMRNAFDRPYLAKTFEKEAGVPEKAAQGMAFGYGKLIGTILGHGSMSVVESKRKLEAAGLSPRAALGFALLIGLHHPNFPITLVHGLAKGLTAKTPSLQIPDRLLGPLLIREGRESESPEMTPAQKEEVKFRDSEALRAKVSAYAADLLGIRPSEARLIAVLGYSLDRVTASRRNTPDARDFRMVGGKPSFVAWNKPGAPLGEIVKKYGLILTNIMNAPDIKTADDVRKFDLKAAFDKTLDSIETETQAAVRSADAALADASLGSTRAERLRLENLRRAVEAKSRYEIGRTREIQRTVLEYAASGRISGFSGLAVDLDKDIALVHAHAEKIGPLSPDYATVSYLLSALVALRTGGTNQATLAALSAVPR